MRPTCDICEKHPPLAELLGVRLCGRCRAPFTRAMNERPEIREAAKVEWAFIQGKGPDPRKVYREADQAQQGT